MGFLKSCVRTVAEWYPASDRAQDAIQAFALSSAFKAWTRRFRAADLPSFPQREQLWDYVIDTYVKEDPVCYLEFGVFDGYSIRHFARRVKHPESRFAGFDTFTGLPEDWGTLATGTFDLQRQTPSINDSRVSFHIGLFQDSLPPFLRTFRAGKSHLVIHCDADLYSSTLFVLTQLAPYMDGAVVLFDEFNALPHEFRALQDFSRAYRMSYRLIGDVHPRLQRAAFEFYAGEKQPCTAPNLAGFVNGSS